SLAGVAEAFRLPRRDDSEQAGDSIFAYRHMTQGSPDCNVCHSAHGGPFMPPNPFGIDSSVVHSVGCTSCHVAHSTSASMGPNSGAVEWPDGSATPAGHSRSSLLRLDNRGECQLSHPK
ncbi:MAG: hypothetical protein ACE5EX_08845, partial [Phycisphaerae bacterium]